MGYYPIAFVDERHPLAPADAWFINQYQGFIHPTGALCGVCPSTARLGSAKS